MVKEKKQDYSLDSRAWRAKIIALYNARCFIKKKTPLIKGDEPQEAHHLFCESSFPEKALDPLNGVRIRRSIHHEFHRLYGRTNCRPEHFEQFLRENYNLNYFPWRENNYYLECQAVEKRFRKSPEFYEIRLLSLAEKRGHIVIRYDNAENKYVNKQTRIVLGCTKHGLKEKSNLWGCEEKKTVMNYFRQSLAMNCCAKESSIETRKNKQKLSVPDNKIQHMAPLEVDKELERKLYFAFEKPPEKKKRNKTLEKHAYVVEKIHEKKSCVSRVYSPIIRNYKYPIY